MSKQEIPHFVPQRYRQLIDELTRKVELRDIYRSMGMSAREIIGDKETLAAMVEPLGSNRYIQMERGKILEHWERAQTECITKKGQIASMLKIFPEEYRINQTVFSVEDKEGIRSQIENCISEGKDAGLRTCYSDGMHKLGTFPWVMGLKTERQVAAFFGDIPVKNIRLWIEPNVKGHQTYKRWLTEEVKRGLKEIIVMENPPELSGTIDSSHFFTFRVFLYKKDKFQIEIRDGTSQLRNVEGSVPRSRLIETSINVGIRKGDYYGTYVPTPVEVFPGNDYLIYPSRFPPRLRWLDLRSSRRIEKIRKNGIRWQSPEDQKLKTVVEPISIRTIDQVTDFIYSTSCTSPFNHLYYRLYALSDIGLEGIEFQGMRSEGENKGWIKAYGFRGTREQGQVFIPPPKTE